MPNPGRVKKIISPFDGSVIARVPVVDTLVTVEGSGANYKKSFRTFTNDVESVPPRKVHTDRVTHKADPDVPGDTDDPTQYLDVQNIDQFITVEGSGHNFRRTFHTVEWDSRTKTHKSKVTHKADPDVPGDTDNPDVWIEIERADVIKTTEGSGRNFQRTTVTLDWNDDEFNAAAYAPDAVVDTDPDESIDPPWRLDPFQRIVNINYAPPFIIFGRHFSMAPVGFYSTLGDSAYLTGLTSSPSGTSRYYGGYSLSETISSSYVVSPASKINADGQLMFHGPDFSNPATASFTPIVQNGSFSPLTVMWETMDNVPAGLPTRITSGPDGSDFTYNGKVLYAEAGGSAPYIAGLSYTITGRAFGFIGNGAWGEDSTGTHSYLTGLYTFDPLVDWPNPDQAWLDANYMIGSWTWDLSGTTVIYKGRTYVAVASVRQGTSMPSILCQLTP